MALLSIANLAVSFGDRRIIDGVNLTLADGEHVGLVGRNGCGKSTLMKLIAKVTKLKPDSGQLQLARGSTVGYLTQDPDLDLSRTLREEAGAGFEELHRLHKEIDRVTDEMATADDDALEQLMKRYEQLEHDMQVAGGYAVDHQIEATLHGVGLTDETFDVKVADLSGGQKGRLALAKLLLAKPDLLLLDEPTNHLDIPGRQWLEQYLAAFPGAVMVVSHDRWLLDRVATKIYELEAGELVEYPGNYHKYVHLRKERFLNMEKAYGKQQQVIKREQAFIDRYRAGQRSKQAQGREKRLERYVEQKQLDRPVELDSIHLNFSPRERCGDIVIAAEHVSKRYDDNILFEDVSLTIQRGATIGVIGPNGAGKSTLVNCLIGELEADKGKIKLGSGVNVGHFKQTHEYLDLSRTLVEYLQVHVDGTAEQIARDLAGAFLFSGDEQDKPLSVLSGGERARAVIAGLMSGGHNLLILDEPTNHLDIPSAQRLEEALTKFTAPASGYSTAENARQSGGGTLILISHDRMLLDELVDELLVFDGHGGCKHFLGNYSEYIATEKSQQQDTSQNQSSSQNETKHSGNKSAKSNSTSKTPITSPDANKSKDKSTSKNASIKSRDAKDVSPQQAAKTKQSSKETWSRNKNKDTKKKSPLERLSQEKLDATIMTTEQKLQDIDKALADPQLYRDGDLVKSLQDERASIQAELTPLEAEWERRASDSTDEDK
jgi:ATP-binding cassette, subfamily F, member 3